MPVPAAPAANATEQERTEFKRLCLEHLRACDLPTLPADFPTDHIPEALLDAGPEPNEEE